MDSFGGPAGALGAGDSCGVGALVLFAGSFAVAAAAGRFLVAFLEGLTEGLCLEPLRQLLPRGWRERQDLLSQPQL